MVTLGGMSGVNLTFGLQNGHSGGMSGVNLTFGLQNGHSEENEWCKPYFRTTEWSLWGE